MMCWLLVKSMLLLLLVLFDIMNMMLCPAVCMMKHDEDELGLMITCMMNIGCYFETLSCTGFPMSMFVLMLFDVVDACLKTP